MGRRPSGTTIWNQISKRCVYVVVRRFLPVLTGAVVVLLAAGCASAAHGSTSVRIFAPRTAAAPPPCRMPTLQSSLAGGNQPGLAGPAARALTGGAATTPITLDNGSFEVTPPPRGARPGVGRASVVCEALASAEIDGAQFGDDAASGMAVGYGLVTVAPSVPINDQLFGQPGMPQAMAAPPYAHRLAWVIVVAHRQMASCPSLAVPNGKKPSPATTTAASPSWDYAIFLADAATGADTLVYTEAAPPPCGGNSPNGPYQTVPIETISVPWRLVSRDANGYSGRVGAEVPPCWTVPATVNVVRGSNMLQVLATSVAGEACGPARPVSVIVDADTVFDNLPKHLVPAPLGPAISSAPLPPAPAPSNTGQLVQLTPQQNGTTLTVKVGDVLVAPPSLMPLPMQLPQTRHVIRSSNAAVIGQLSPTSMGLPEFRAWQPGIANLSDSSVWSLTVVVAGR